MVSCGRGGTMTKTSDQGELRKFVAPEFVFGRGARFLAGRYLMNFGVRKALVVTDRGVTAAGWTGQVIDSIASEGISSAVFSDVTSNPRDYEVMEGARVYKNEGCSAIVAVGGGSPMDCAKGIGIVSSNVDNILSFEGVDNVPLPGPPLICVPTTAGTSADVSQFAIISDTVRKIKIAIVSKSVIPDAALIDPETTVSMDRELTAYTGLDALTHAVEAYVSNAQSPITDLHALESIRLVSAHLVQAIRNPDDREARTRMMMGSLHAGLAFSNASLGAVHAMAHSLGGYLDFSHGEANAILLPYVIEYNFTVAAERYQRIGEAMGLAGRKNSDVVAAFVHLQQEAGVYKRLGAVGLQKDHIPQLARTAMNDACMVTNPRRPTVQDIEHIYEKAL
jgi:alcohol dehydrogenase